MTSWPAEVSRVIQTGEQLYWLVFFIFCCYASSSHKDLMIFCRWQQLYNNNIVNLFYFGRRFWTGQLEWERNILGTPFVPTSLDTAVLHSFPYNLAKLKLRLETMATTIGADKSIWWCVGTKQFLHLFTSSPVYVCYSIKQWNRYCSHSTAIGVLEIVANKTIDPIYLSHSNHLLSQGKLVLQSRHW